jgi:hypothetical protein
MRWKSVRMNLVVTFLCAAAVCLCAQATHAKDNDWLTGAGFPTPQLGEDGNLYLDLDSGRLFRRTAGTWLNVGLLRAGALARGPGWLSGSDSPTKELGDEGDMYLDIKTGSVFKKDSGTWLLHADLKGKDGPQGLKGETGSAGPTGPAQAVNCETTFGATTLLPPGAPM